MLACSFDSVSKRIADRGSHSAPFAEEDAGALADSILQALFSEEQPDRLFVGFTQEQFSEQIYSRRLIWAPDGDEAFDDGSYVLQFDIASGVRLVGFKRAEHYLHAPATLTDLSISADKYYGILEHWRRAFEAEWASFPKTQEERG